jgi:hypothetical protein
MPVARKGKAMVRVQFNFLSYHSSYQSYSSLYHFLPAFYLVFPPQAVFLLLITDSFQTPFTLPQKIVNLCLGACSPHPVSTQTNPTAPITTHISTQFAVLTAFQFFPWVVYQ